MIYDPVNTNKKLQLIIKKAHLQVPELFRGGAGRSFQFSEILKCLMI